ncbi:unnamed protein product, partial [marine sediment metagenome]
GQRKPRNPAEAKEVRDSVRNQLSSSERREFDARRDEAIHRSLKVKKPQSGDEMFIATNTSASPKGDSGSHGRRVNLAKPGGQMAITGREIDRQREGGSGEFDRAFQKVVKFDPDNPRHRELLERK